MANNASTIKRIRQNEKRRARNRVHRSRLRSSIKQLRAAVAEGDAGAARSQLTQTISLLSSTAQHGAIHRNAAARTASRLTRAVNALGA